MSRDEMEEFRRKYTKAQEIQQAEEVQEVEEIQNAEEVKDADEASDSTPKGHEAYLPKATTED